MASGFMLNEEGNDPHDSGAPTRLENCQPSDLRAIARHLEGVAAAIEAGSSGKPRSPRGADRPPLRRSSLVELARRIYLCRELRWQIFNDHLLGEPAWDIMLDLYYHAGSGRRITTTEAQYAGHAPASTSLRYLDRLEEDNLIQRAGSSRDKRRRYVLLSDKGSRAMERYLTAIEELSSLDDGTDAEQLVRRMRSDTKADSG